MQRKLLMGALFALLPLSLAAPPAHADESFFGPILSGLTDAQEAVPTPTPAPVDKKAKEKGPRKPKPRPGPPKDDGDDE